MSLLIILHLIRNKVQKLIMKKSLILLILSLIVIGTTCTSCFTSRATIASTDSRSNISSNRTNLTVKIFQTLNKNEALAFTEQFDVVKIVTVTDMYYDGKQIKGNFTLVGTYTYETEKERIKTVPVFVLTSEYKKHKDIWE